MVFVYDKILTNDVNGKRQYVCSNLHNYDIHPWHTGDYYRLNEIEERFNIKFPYQRTDDESPELHEFCERFRSQSFEVFLDHRWGSHTVLTLSEVENKDINYIYPLLIYSNEIFLKYDTIDLPNQVVNDAQKGKCKICFMQPTEGFFGMQYDNYVWLDNLSLKYNLSKESLYIITTNFRANEMRDNLVESGHVRKDSYSILEYSYFATNIWFWPPGYVTDPDFSIQSRKLLSDQLPKILNEKDRKKFLNFNRIPKLHRVLLYGMFNSVEELKDSAITTLGASENGAKDAFHAFVSNDVNSDFTYKNDLLRFYSTYDSSQHAWYDEPDMENNKASSLNLEAHSKTFINIISESLIHPTTIFFSEKTFKPILVCQPFILVGNPHSLRSLREQGYKTFSRWWDESYDEEEDFYKRFEKISKLIIEISQWDDEKCYSITQEMLPTLMHNFNVLLEGRSVKELMEKLSDFGPNTKTYLI